MFKHLYEQVALITGASSGLGRDLALRLVGLGTKVMAIGRDTAKLVGLQEEIEHKENFAFTAADVSDFDAIQTISKHTVDRWGSIDILVNCAGVRIPEPLEELSKQAIDNAIGSMFTGTIYCTRLVAPIMMQNGGGCIINISSMAGLRGLHNNGIYSACKHGLQGFSDSLSKYLAPYNIHVMTLCMGGMDTPRWDQATNVWHTSKDQLLQVGEVSELIEFVLKGRAHTLYKNVEMFPISEVENW